MTQQAFCATCLNAVVCEASANRLLGKVASPPSGSFRYQSSPPESRSSPCHRARPQRPGSNHLKLNGNGCSNSLNRFISLATIRARLPAPYLDDRSHPFTRAVERYAPDQRREDVASDLCHANISTCLAVITDGNQQDKRRSPAMILHHRTSPFRSLHPRPLNGLTQILDASNLASLRRRRALCSPLASLRRALPVPSRASCAHP